MKVKIWHRFMNSNCGSPVWTEQVWCVMLNTGSVGRASPLWWSGHLDPQCEAFYWVQDWWEGSRCFSWSECSGLSWPPRKRIQNKGSEAEMVQLLCVYASVWVCAYLWSVSMCVHCLHIQRNRFNFAPFKIPKITQLVCIILVNIIQIRYVRVNRLKILP